MFVFIEFIDSDDDDTRNCDAYFVIYKFGMFTLPI